MLVVNVDARTDHHDNHRKFSVSGAVANLLDKLDVSDGAVVKSVVDYDGENVDVSYFRVLVNKTKGDRAFVTRKVKDGLCSVIRVS